MYVYRRTKIEWKSSGSQVKLVGVLISIVGATSLTLYRGPVVKNSPFSPSSFLNRTNQDYQQLFVFLSTHEYWILGCILYAAASLSLSAWNIIQVYIYIYILYNFLDFNFFFFFFVCNFYFILF